jgi:hypothetical protein
MPLTVLQRFAITSLQSLKLVNGLAHNVKPYLRVLFKLLSLAAVQLE